MKNLLYLILVRNSRCPIGIHRQNEFDMHIFSIVTTQDDILNIPIIGLISHIILGLVIIYERRP